MNGVKDSQNFEKELLILGVETNSPVFLACIHVTPGEINASRQGLLKNHKSNVFREREKSIINYTYNTTVVHCPCASTPSDLVILMTSLITLLTIFFRLLTISLNIYSTIFFLFLSSGSFVKPETTTNTRGAETHDFFYIFFSLKRRRLYLGLQLSLWNSIIKRTLRVALFDKN